MGDSVKRLSEVEVGNIHCSPLMYPASHAIIEGCQIGQCPAFGQDRVNFHQKPGGDTAERADPNWPNRTGCLIPCAVMLGSGWGRWAGGKRVVSREHVGHWAVRVALCISLFVLYILHIGIVVLLFTLFAVQLNCPYPDPQVFAFFIPFSSAPQRREGR